MLVDLCRFSLSTCICYLFTAPFSLLLFFTTLPRPPRSTLFPYTTLFRSQPASTLRTAHEKYLRDREQRLSVPRSEEHTSELQSLRHLVCRLLLEKKKENSRRQSRTNPKNKRTESGRTTRGISTERPDTDI